MIRHHSLNRECAHPPIHTPHRNACMRVCVCVLVIMNIIICTSAAASAVYSIICLEITLAINCHHVAPVLHATTQRLYHRDLMKWTCFCPAPSSAAVASSSSTSAGGGGGGGNGPVVYVNVISTRACVCVSVPHIHALIFIVCVRASAYYFASALAKPVKRASILAINVYAKNKTMRAQTQTRHLTSRPLPPARHQQPAAAAAAAATFSPISFTAALD